MKKIFKTVVCLAIAASLCIMSAGAAFASDAASDLSLDDLLNLLTQLTGSEDTEEVSEDIEDVAVAEENADVTEITVGSFTFDVPTSWYENVEEAEDGTCTYYSPDYNAWVTVTYTDGLTDADQLDLTSDDQIAMMEEALTNGGTLLNSEVKTIDGVTVLSTDVSYEMEDLSFESCSLVIPYEGELLLLGVSGFEDFSADFQNVYDSIVIGEGSADAPAAPAAPAADAAEGLDASAGEVVLIDDDVCTVTIKSFSEDDYYALVGKVFVENKTDLNLYVTFDDVSVNGYMCDPWFGTSVSAGHKSNEEMHFRQNDLDAAGITDIRDIEFTLHVRDDDDYSADYLEEQIFSVYPNGMDVPEQAEPTFNDDAIVMVDNDDVKMLITGFSEDENYVYAHVYLENNTDSEMEFRVAGDSTVNGYEISPYFYKDVMPGKKAFTDMTWYVSDLDDNDIETIEDMELELIISDANDWSVDPIFEEHIPITFE